VLRRLWLLLPALCLYSADVALTVIGQPAAYWGGDYSQAVEHNPLAHPLLSWHPALFVGVALGWAVAFGTVVMLWRNRLSDWFAILLALGHAVGGSSWLARQGVVGWVLAVAYLVVAAGVSGVCWRRAGLRPGNR
jgi:hypothetical protein